MIEVVNDRATITRLNISDLKARAVDEIKSEFVTKDFVRAEIAEVRQEIAEVKEELRAEIASVKEEIAEVRQEIAEVKAELKAEVAEVKVDILKWVLGMQVATITIILAGMKFLLS